MPMSLNHACPNQPAPEFASSARLLGEVRLGAGTVLAQGLVVRAHGGAVEIDHHSAVLENGVVVGWPASPVRIGQRTVFGHRCQVIGATVGNLCEIGNGAILMPGARLGDGVILGEGTLIPPHTTVPSHTVLVGRPAKLLRAAADKDSARIARLRDHQVELIEHPSTVVTGQVPAGGNMGRLYSYRDTRPELAEGVVLFDSAEITGDVHVGHHTIIGAGVKIIGDSDGPVRIGERVQILENTVLHLLPDNDLIIGDDVTIGPGCMIHGCRIGAGTVIEPAAIICDWAELGAGCLVRAGSCVTQRHRFGDLSVIEGMPAHATANLEAPLQRPDWALRPDALDTICRLS
jgi:carbonic anhydrase/acetyltransferase-like protein (isoleucine patch superfamily)